MVQELVLVVRPNVGLPPLGCEGFADDDLGPGRIEPVREVGDQLVGEPAGTILDQLEVIIASDRGAQAFDEGRDPEDVVLDRAEGSRTRGQVSSGSLTRSPAPSATTSSTWRRTAAPPPPGSPIEGPS